MGTVVGNIRLPLSLFLVWKDHDLNGLYSYVKFVEVAKPPKLPVVLCTVQQSERTKTNRMGLSKTEVLDIQGVGQLGSLGTCCSGYR